ncbi:pentapeptide repeat-containing protein [Bacillus sp. BRMEA1]|uniref:pentapeptide repeat-containing protein n=1 Tax=Neobacillus endophyticus TaxID=2738405 RepID=UPI001563DFEF|nr:pentapeptide repeat-containing protein [Neobacillus endophyticus]NRD79510.1 pentapeptide repeat-containing protein [Neobacillus endophyticus]
MLKSNDIQTIRSSLRSDCENCFGLCCVALNFAATADFAIDKGAGIPCPNLQSDFRCAIHKSLRHKGFKGCTVFECFGAGQKVSQSTFNRVDWRQNPETAKKMFAVFPIMQELHEMLLYVTEALAIKAGASLTKELEVILEETKRLTQLDADRLLELDIPNIRANVNTLLLQISDLVRSRFNMTSKNQKKVNRRGADLIGANLKGADLCGVNFRGAYLIAANLRNSDLSGADLIGADLRDADLSGANLGESIFLTQMQINSAKGDSQTKLPSHIARPSHWSV